MFKRCNYPKGAPPEVAAALAAAVSGAPSAPFGFAPAMATMRAAADTHAPMSAIPAVAASAAFDQGIVDRQGTVEKQGIVPMVRTQGASTPPLMCTEILAPPACDDDEEEQLFWGAVEGCLALAGGGKARRPPALPTFRPARPHVAAQMAQAAQGAASGGLYDPAAREEHDENDGGQGVNRGCGWGGEPYPMDSGGMHALLGGIGQVILPGGKRLRSARCGTCAGCNSGDCGTCKNCVDKPKFGGPGCRKQACMARTCSAPRVVDDDELAPSSDGFGAPVAQPASVALDATGLQALIQGARAASPAAAAAAAAALAPWTQAASSDAHAPRPDEEESLDMPAATPPTAQGVEPPPRASPQAEVEAAMEAAAAAATATAAAAAAAAASAVALGRAPVASVRVPPPPAPPVSATAVSSTPVAATPMAAPAAAPSTAAAALAGSPPVPSSSHHSTISFTPINGGVGSSAVSRRSAPMSAGNADDSTADADVAGSGGSAPLVASGQLAMAASAIKLPGVVLAAAKTNANPATPVCATAASNSYLASKYVGHTSELPQGVAESIFGPINRTLSTEGA